MLAFLQEADKNIDATLNPFDAGAKRKTVHVSTEGLSGKQLDRLCSEKNITFFLFFSAVNKQTQTENHSR